MDVGRSLSALRRRWLMLLAFVLAGAGLGAAHYATTPPTYQSTTSVYFSLTRTQTVGELAQGSTYLQGLVQSYAQVATSRLVLTPVIQQLDLGLSPTELARRIRAKPRPNTAIMDIRVTHDSPREAAAVANAVGAELRSAVSTLSPRSNPRVSSVTMTTITEAAVPAGPSAPKLAVDLGVGIFIGLALGALAVAVREALRSPVASREAAEEATSAPVLTMVGREHWRRHPVPVVDDPRSPQAEAFYMLRTNLQSAQAADRPLRLVVASAGPGEGRTSTAVNLAIAVSHTEHQVLLVDADLRRPAVAGLLGLDEGEGLSTVLTGAASLDDAVRGLAVPGEQSSRLALLSAGPLPPNPSELLATAVMDKILDSASRRYDVVIIDTSPLLHATDAALLASRVDGALLVVDSRRTSRRELAEAVTRLRLAGAAILGVVLNRTRPEHLGRYGRVRARLGRPGHAEHPAAASPGG